MPTNKKDSAFWKDTDTWRHRCTEIELFRYTEAQGHRDTDTQ